MKIYVIEKGCYSDRHIIAVVETKAEAEEICKAISGRYRYDKADYTEYDTKQFQTGLFRFEVKGSGYGNDWEADYDDYDFYSKIIENTRIYDGEYIIYARNKEEAVKIAQDMEAVYKAEKAGIV